MYKGGDSNTLLLVVLEKKLCLFGRLYHVKQTVKGSHHSTRRDSEDIIY